MERLKYCVNLVIATMLLLVVAINSNNRYFGNSVQAQESKKPKASKFVPAETKGDNGERIINTTSLAKDVIGYGGTTPLQVIIKDNVIVEIIAEENDETPQFFDSLTDKGLFKKWNGLTPSEAARAKIDGVSGATYSSQAVIENVRRAGRYAASSELLQ